jgi:hypothetical protein
MEARRRHAPVPDRVRADRQGLRKSPLAAGTGLYGLSADNEERAEIYAAAAKDQAMILFRDAVSMVAQS